MLKLPGDGPALGQKLRDALPKDGTGPIVAAVAEALPPLAARLAAGRLHGNPEAIVGTNDSGDKQKALDVAAHDHMMAALRAVGVRDVLSEEAEQIVHLNPDGAFDVAIDPIDGSGSIGIGAPLGMIFSIMPPGDGGFLRTGRAIVAAGYASLGHSVDFGYSLGDGVNIATYDVETGDFRLVAQNVWLKPTASTFAYNASNEQHWNQRLQTWLRDMHKGKDGPFKRIFNMRWLAAAVGELHRILLKGGVFLYPADTRPGYEHGRLRLIYECAPIAFLIEQAGGQASDGATPILDLTPTSLHQMTPFIFGAKDEVETILGYIANHKG